MTELLTAMIRVSASQRASAAASTYMFGLKPFVGLTTSGVERAGFAALALSLHGFSFTSAAMLTTLVPAAVE